MSERVQKPKPQPTKQVEQPQPQPKTDAEAAALKKATDDLLDEIDGILEENAEEFVKNYVQKGGQ